MTKETLYGMNIKSCKAAGSEFHFYPYKYI